MIATCSGQRKFILPTHESDEESDDESDEEQVIDNTLKAWRVPGQYQWYTYDADPSADIVMETAAVIDTVVVPEDVTSMVVEADVVTDMVTEAGEEKYISTTTTTVQQ